MDSPTIDNTGLRSQDWSSDVLGNYAIIKGRIGWRGLKSDEYTDSGPYLIAGQHIANGKVLWSKCHHLSQFRYNESPEIMLREEDIIISKDGTIGRVAYIDSLPGEATLNSTMMLVRITKRNKLEPQFVAYFLQGETFKKLVAERVSGSSVPHLFQADMKELLINFPPVHEQRQIARILATLDTIIEKTTQLIAKYAAIKQGLMQDLFTRGVDAQGRLRPSVAKAPHLYAESTPLGPLPQGWAVKRLDDISIFITSGPRGWARYYANDGAVFLRVGNLTRRHINFRLENLVYVSPPDSSEGDRTLLQAGDILISVTADLGMIGVIPNSFPQAYINQHIALVRANAEVANPRWVGSYLLSRQGQNQFYRLNDAGAKSGMNLSAVGAVMLAIPPLYEQKRLVNFLDMYDQRIEMEKRYLAKLQQQKQALMQDLLTGRVRLPAREATP